MAPIIRLRRRAYLEACLKRELLTTVAQGRALGLGHSSVWRILDGLSAPGTAFIAGAIRTFPELGFDGLFEVVDEPADDGDEDAA